MQDTSPGWSALELAALHAVGVSPRRLRALRAQFQTAADYRAAGPAPDRPPLPEDLTGVLPEGVWVLAEGNPGYPPALAAGTSPPVLLYGRGEPAALAAGVAVVGTRDVTDLGRIVAGLAAQSAAAVGAPVVSGLARGVDTAAAEAALAADVPTVAVLAAGVCHPTPRDNADLAGRILAAGGALVSEQLPTYDPATADRADRTYARLLQARNRIIAGLASVVVPCEGAVRSGTIGTVWAALASGRPVVVAEPRPAARRAAGARLPLLLASRQARTAAELTALGAPTAVAAAHAGTGTLASGVAADREQLHTLIEVAHRLSPWRDPALPSALDRDAEQLAAVDLAA